MPVSDELLTISAFGRLVGLTPSALRFYDDCGLLRPVRVDESSGYRLYAHGQESRGVLLRLLREVDLPLVQARLVLDGSPDEAARIVQAHLRTLEDRLGPARRAAAIVLASLSDPSSPSPSSRSSTVWACRVTLPGPELASAVRQVAPAAAATTDRPALACVLLDISGDEVVFVASDRYRLAMRVLPVGRFDGVARRVLVPATVMSELASWAARRHEVHLTVTDHDATLSAGDEQHPVPVVEADFPDYQTVLQGLAPSVSRAIVDRTGLLDLLVSGDLPSTVVIDVGHDQVRVGGPGGPHTAFEAVCTGEAMRLGFATSVLGAALAAGVGPDALLELAGPDRAVIIRSADQGTFTTLAMPTLLRPADFA